jgi:ribosomal protein S27AE
MTEVLRCDHVEFLEDIWPFKCVDGVMTNIHFDKRWGCPECRYRKEREARVSE